MPANLIGRLRSNLKRRFDSPLFHYEQLRGMFIPLLLDQLFIYGIGLLSGAMVSSSGMGAISAVNDAFVVSNLAYVLFSAIATGAGIVIARAKGAGDALSMRRAIGQSCTLCTVFGSLIGILLYLFGAQIVRLLYPAADAQVVEAAGEYLSVMGISMIPYSLFNGIFTAFRSMGDTKSSLALTLVINSIHLICSLLYINVLHLGVSGSALSYLTARVIGMAFALFWLMRPACALHMRWRDFARIEKRTLKDIVSLGVPLSVEQVLFQGGMLLVQLYIATLPGLQTDAQGVANSVFLLFYVFAYSLTSIAATVCGQCIGAKDMRLARFYCKGIIWAGRWILAFSLVILLPLMPLILKLYAPQAEAIKYIYIAVCIGSLPMPLVWPDAYVFASCTRAAGDTVYATVVSIATLFAGRLLLGYVLTIVLGLGMPGIWLGQLAEWCIRAACFRLRFKGTGWIKVDLSGTAISD